MSQVVQGSINKWTVVHFILTNEVNLVPSSWIKHIDGKCVCLWPERDKNINKKVKKLWLPDPTWQTFEIRILKECDTYEIGRECEKRLENESTDCNVEEKLGRGNRKLKRKSNPDFVGEILPPPKLVRTDDQFEQVRDNNLDETHEGAGVNNLHNSFSPPGEENIEATNYVVINGILTEEDRSATENQSNSSNCSNLDHHETSTITMSSTSNSQIESEPTAMGVYGVMVEIREMFTEIKTCLLNFPNTTTTRMSLEKTPKQPFKKYHKLMEYEHILIDDAEAQNQLETMLYLLGGSNAKEMIKRGLKTLFTNKLAVRCSWTGRNHNYPLKNLIIIRLLKTAARKRFSDLTDCTFEEMIKTWFRQSSLRYSRECAKASNPNN